MALTGFLRIAGPVMAAATLACASSGGPESDAGAPDAALPPCENGRFDGDETDTDCGGGCEACAVGRGCRGPDDCRSGVCLGGVCREADTCVDGARGEAETDVDCGGPLCEPCGIGEGCALDRDCTSTRCRSGRCEPSCGDGVRNGDESDVDCGGSCDPCAVGAACGAGGDCASRVCDGGACAAPRCDDGVENGTETGPDCGGPLCPGRCAPGEGCEGDGDCASAACRDGACLDTTCFDGVANGTETDVDCGGVCPACPPGAACSTSVDCARSVCDAGTCAGAASCLALRAIDPTLPSGTYAVGAEGDRHDVWCDMATDGGGWTLVAATRDVTLDDAAGDAHEDLATLEPAAAHPTVWDGLRPAIPDTSDIRFACRQDPDGEGFDVDLVFYRTPWYRTVTTGTDAQSCFSPGNGAGYTRPAPARRDLVGDVLVRRGDDWDAGYLEGEDQCDDGGDFTVDLDDRGVDGDESDGTDWGEDDGARKCGVEDLSGGAWLVFVREFTPRCGNDTLDPGESDVDCGGPCAPCPEDAACVEDGDCGDGLECGPLATCVGPCENGRRDGDETDVDCGGSCATGCGLRGGCAVSADCADARLCLDDRCHPASCDDDVEGGDETDVDCGGSCPRCGNGEACGVAADCVTGRCTGSACARAADCDAIRGDTPTLPSDVYEIQPGTTARRVWCDMETDGGGWTLVAATRTTVLNDQASGYYADLESLFPASGHFGVWDGMRSAIAGTSDVRFVCKQDPRSSEVDVDLSFYDVGWYREWTTGTDADSCFSEGNGAGYDTPAPARRNNLTGDALPTGDDWDADDYLEGEDFCGDTGDFTVDFDDRGMDSDESDGTDWGEDDFGRKCGESRRADGAWFLFVR